MSNENRRPFKQTGPLDGRRLPPRETTLSPRISFTDRASQAPSHLLAQIGHEDNSITTVGMTVKPKLIIGREDPSINYIPDLNLSEFNGQGAGVSRQHAFIVEEDGQLFLLDNNSKNGTFHNNRKLDSHEQVPLQDGDLIVLGRLPVVLYFVYD
jgi:pSer/pThr/pTyr-binding forkhead associated (FHA) protein